MDHGDGNFFSGEFHNAKQDHEQPANDIRLCMKLLKHLADCADSQCCRDQDRCDAQAKDDRHPDHAVFFLKNIGEVAWEEIRDAAGSKEGYHTSEEGGY